MTASTECPPRPDPGLYRGRVHGTLTERGKAELGRERVGDRSAVANPEDVVDWLPVDLVVRATEPWKRDQPRVSVDFYGWPAFGHVDLARKGVGDEGRYVWRAVLEDHTRGGVFVSKVRAEYPESEAFLLTMKSAPATELEPWVSWRGSVCLEDRGE